MDDKKLYKQLKWKLFLLGLIKIPMIGYVRPKLLHLDGERVEVKIKLRRRTRNHLKSMYFGALAVGADMCAGIHAFYYAEKYQKRISFAFKDIKGEFHKRAETDVTFVMNEGKALEKAVQDSQKTGERYNVPVKVEALNTSGEVVASFILTSSVKVK